MSDRTLKTPTCTVFLYAHFDQCFMQKVFYKKEAPTEVFSRKFYNMIESTFFIAEFWVIASITIEVTARRCLIKKAVLKNGAIFNFFYLLLIYSNSIHIFKNVLK